MMKIAPLSLAVAASLFGHFGCADSTKGGDDTGGDGDGSGSQEPQPEPQMDAQGTWGAEHLRRCSPERVADLDPFARF